MTRATWYTGDALTVLRTLPDGSVDLVITSPPFLALRSYLPGDHPDKALELGAEPNPGEFIDALMPVVEECRRLLKDSGSIAIELGDTYAGSGGAGGDYNPGGLRAGQPKYRQGTQRWDRPEGQTRGAAYPPEVVKNGGGDGWPLPKSLALVPESLRFTMVYGRNPHTGRETEPWRLRNVVRWCRPNPPVGALGDKYRPATTEMAIFAKNRFRYFDLDSVRTEHSRDPETMDGTSPVRGTGNRKTGGDDRFEGQGTRPKPGNPNGAPPKDYWEMPTQPYKGAHYATWPRKLLEVPIRSMCPPDGMVLDPFAGSGTTLEVATGLGRNAIGIDIDERNQALALQRVGGLLLEIAP